MQKRIENLKKILNILNIEIKKDKIKNTEIEFKEKEIYYKNIENRTYQFIGIIENLKKEKLLDVNEKRKIIEKIDNFIEFFFVTFKNTINN